MEKQLDIFHLLLVNIFNYMGKLMCYQSLPNFLVIGAGRSGTTWLYENLKRCKNVWLPPVKEIHYFDRNLKYSSPSFLHDKYFLKRLLGCEFYNKDFKIKMLKSIGRCIINSKINDLLWCLRYYLGTIDDDWYLSLFRDAKNKITGDITPAYQLLKEEDISSVYKLLPNAKILFIIRNPVYRTWSQLRKNKQTKLPYNKIQNILKSSDIAMRNDYLYTIRNWQKYYPANQFKLLFYDDIVQAPKKLLNDIFSFLSVENCSEKLLLMNNRVNSAPFEAFDPNIKKLIIENSFENIEKIAQEVGSYAKNWLAEANDFLNSMG